MLKKPSQHGWKVFPVLLRFSVSHVLYVLLFRKKGERGNHLSAVNLPFVSFLIPRQKAPLPLFGLLARGVYRVPPNKFPYSLRHCGTFKDTKA